MERYRNAYDNDIIFSKNGIVDYINRFLEKEEGEEGSKWEMKVN
jgi:hypothetical protein